MHRRTFAKSIPALLLAPTLAHATPEAATTLRSATSLEGPANVRHFWYSTLARIADPVLDNLAMGKLKKRMPVEAKAGHEQDRREVTYLEAFGRLLAGMTPWLELGPDSTSEGQVRDRYLQVTHRALQQAVDPKGPDFMNFNRGKQPLVDAAFLAHGLLRAPTQLWQKADATTQQRLIDAMVSSRAIAPYYSNWLLFSAMVEAFLLDAGQPWDEMRVDLAVRKHLEWYKGDGLYGDGPDFHWDYYNSYVIQPMLLDILRVLHKYQHPLGEHLDVVLARAQRYAEIQERLISPEGTFPPIGRSLPYRFGAFQLLAQMALLRALPLHIQPSQVRSALTAVIHRMIEAPGTFDKDGWLRIGFFGHQPDIAETYISTGSLYLCSVGLLPLGLPPDDVFWSEADADWTAKKVWAGLNVPPDHALGV
ncbi:hypothetical protein SAMN05421823_105296 [Catalinimonas alkaloidigena]|uniref:DUF2264 domain-containing protein n=1 Tax=Catalinimonas alkaloidigena TaxID=1075417 RepID=A0A1G9JEW5_9BACT|nr:DUF2264 domain-containing protein [Catalinimonas alkaloidigena]SDL36100.1 hypothetical protein SAMN05421823_105296 [Catalinimonas alkaloidigena]